MNYLSEAIIIKLYCVIIRYSNEFVIYEIIIIADINKSNTKF